jgi:antitoxin (DNA-binding transcriptional repressor) of toxin-antitoxin stability system
MTQLTHEQYDMLERAVIRGTRVAVFRKGRPESLIVPLSLHLRDGREAIEARHPTTGHDLTIYLDDVERIEVVG